MKRNGIILTLIFMLLVVSSGVHAEDLDLMPFARVTATGTRNTFFLLWPRDTDDGPFTVRDGNAETGWKIPAQGSQELIIDFAPVLKKMPAIERIVPDWETPPEHAPMVRQFDFCGGSLLDESAWANPEEEFLFASPVQAGCLTIAFTDAGRAGLLELQLYAAKTDEAPRVDDAEWTPVEYGIRVDWTVSETTGLVRLDLLEPGEEELTEDSLLEIVPADGFWVGPSPLLEGSKLAVTPLTLDGMAGESEFLTPPVRDIPLYPRFGVIEGFYGTLWSAGERRRMMLQMSRMGFGSYLYQPKWDLLNREQWREQYSDDEIAEFSALRRYGKRLGVTMIFGLGPAFDMVVDDPEERAALLFKLEPFVEAGFRDFELGFDDIEFALADPVDGAMGAKHVDLVNWTKGQLEEMAGEPIHMWMMPTPYSTDRQYNYFPEGTEYIDQLIDLDPSVRLLWNGPDTFARNISAEDLEDITARSGRKPVIWENMHCNDAGDAFIGKFYQAPMMNRAPDMIEAVDGFMTNPLILGAANRLIYGSYLQYASDPFGYDPEKAMPDSVAMEVTEEWDQALALRISEHYWGLGIIGPEGSSVTRNRSMESGIDELKEALSGKGLAEILTAGENLLAVAAWMALVQNDLHHSGFSPDLVDDLWFPADRLVHEGRALLYLLDWLGARLAGLDDNVGLTRAEEILIQALLHDRYYTSLFRVNFFKRWLEKQSIGVMGFEEPQFLVPEQALIPAGVPWSFDTEAAGEVRVFGLAGALVDGPVFSWTPTHGGTYRAICTFRSEKGWAWREFTLIVQNPVDGPDDDDDDNDDDDDDDDNDSSDGAGDDDEEDGSGCCG